MPAHPPQTHPAKAYLDEAGRRWPGLWAACEAIRAAYPQPPECYINDHFGAAAFVQAVRESGNDEEMKRLRGLDEYGAGRARIRNYVDPIINMLLYICSIGDISGKRGQPGNPQPVRTRRDGWRLYAADGIKTWDVGVRMGTALRAAYQAERHGNGEGGGGSVRGHIRRAHWHGFRSGPRKREDGSEIPAEKRRFDLRWMPPIPVKLDGVDNMPATIRPVK